MKDENIKCPVCGNNLENYDYAYDNKQYGKIYLKCNECGHKELKKG